MFHTPREQSGVKLLVTTEHNCNPGSSSQLVKSLNGVSIFIVWQKTTGHFNFQFTACDALETSQGSSGTCRSLWQRLFVVSWSIDPKRYFSRIKCWLRNVFDMQGSNGQSIILRLVVSDFGLSFSTFSLNYLIHLIDQKKSTGIHNLTFHWSGSNSDQWCP